MDLQRTLRELQEPTRIDRVGRACLARFGRKLTTYEAILLENSPAIPAGDSLSYLASDEGRRRVEEMRQSFTRRYPQGLPESVFMTSGRDIDLEKMLCYVAVGPHRHEFIEITYVLQGQCTHTLGDHTAVQSVGDLTIVPPGLLHCTDAAPDCICFNIKLRREFLQQHCTTLLPDNSLLSSYFTQILSDAPRRSAVTLHSGADPFLQHTMLALWAQQAEGRIYADDIIHALWRALLAYLLQNYQDTLELQVSDSPQSRQIAGILDYIYENYQAVTLAETARHFLLSVPYLSTRIRQLTGSTFTELLRSYRLQRAAELLCQTDLKLAAICEAVGYQDPAQFIRSFKAAYHCTPGQYRRANARPSP